MTTKTVTGKIHHINGVDSSIQTLLDENDDALADAAAINNSDDLLIFQGGTKEKLPVSLLDARIEAAIAANEIMDTSIKTGDYQVVAGDNYIRCNGTFTVTLPEATGSGLPYIIKNVGTGIVTVVSGGNGRIDGEVIQSLAQYECLWVVDEAADTWDALISRPITPVTLTVAGSGGDFTSIKAAMAEAASHATYRTPYRIYVQNGTYQEIQIDGVDWVTIEGQSRSGVIVVIDGTRTDVDPISGQRYVDMTQASKHGFWIHHTMTLRNLTLRANDVKYCIHSDDSGDYELACDNVWFEHANGFPVGIGARAHENFNFLNCLFMEMYGSEPNGHDGSHGIFYHNWNNDSGPAHLTIRNCTFDTCGMVHFLELGSNYTDLTTIADCTGADKPNYFEVTEGYYVPAGTKAQVPYNLIQLIINSPSAVPVVYSLADRPNLASYITVL